MATAFIVKVKMIGASSGFQGELCGGLESLLPQRSKVLPEPVAATLSPDEQGLSFPASYSRSDSILKRLVTDCPYIGTHRQFWLSSARERLHTQPRVDIPRLLPRA